MLHRLPEMFSWSSMAASSRVVLDSPSSPILRKWLAIGKPSILGQFTCLSGSSQSKVDHKTKALCESIKYLPPADDAKNAEGEKTSMFKKFSSKLAINWKNWCRSKGIYHPSLKRFSQDQNLQLGISSRGSEDQSDNGSGKRLPTALLMSATAAAYNWDENGIQESELCQTASEINLIKADAREDNSDLMNIDETSEVLEGWDKVLHRNNLVIFRRKVPGPETHLFEYKTFGTFEDIPARAFFNAQLDIEFRKTWDKYLIKLDVVDKDKKSETELVQWITHFPYPMYPREYVYLRRWLVDTKKKVMTIVARHSEHPKCPKQAKYVRVDRYVSSMVIKPHGNSFDENGFDYILTYSDDPKSNIPTIAYKWLASTGVPDFVEKIHDAAKKLQDKRSKTHQQQQEGEYPGDTLPM